MRRGDDGFILVAVIGALLVLTGLVGAVAYLVQTAVIGAATTRDELLADSLLRSGVRLAGYQLYTLRRPAAAMAGQQVRFNDGVVTLFAEAEAGKIDLNGAPPELLAAAWRSIGSPGLSPEAFAARVADFRDEDSDRTKGGGAEAADYAAVGPDRAPQNAPFEQVDDLQNVLGVSLDAVRALRPLLTVHNPAGKISAFDAPTAVLNALPGGRVVAERIQALRARPPQDANENLEARLGPAAQFVTVEQRPGAVKVRVEARRGASVRSAVVTLTPSPVADMPFLTTDWEDVPPLP